MEDEQTAQVSSGVDLSRSPQVVSQVTKVVSRLSLVLLHDVLTVCVRSVYTRAAQDAVQSP